MNVGYNFPMKIIDVNPEVCSKCGKCIDICGQGIFRGVYSDPGSKRLTGVEVHDERETCTECGHCLAICPTHAIQYEGADACWDSPLIKDPTQISPDQINGLLRARRSIRRYKEGPLAEELIRGVLESMRYAPSASNQQAWDYLVLTDLAKIKALSDRVVKVMKLGLQLLSNKIIQTLFIHGNLGKQVREPGYLESGWNIIQRAENGEDPIFFGAPCVIILHSPKYGNLDGCDAGIALTYGMLAAQSRGLGTCWIGFAQESLQRLPKLRRWLGIPKGRQVWGVMTLGGPKHKFQWAPPRNPLRVKWNGQ